MPRINILDTENRWDHNSLDEYLWWPRVLWIDPGVVSGVAVIWFDPKALFARQKTAKILLAYSEMFLHGKEIGNTGQINHFLRLREKLDEESGLATGCETFVPRKLIQSREFLSPARIGHSIEYGMSKTKPLGSEVVGSGVQLFWQSPSDAIGAFSNDRLKQLRMYSPGPDHVNDAKRHALLWIRKLVDDRELFHHAHGNEEGWFE